jgi:hypothetical protein
MSNPYDPPPQLPKQEPAQFQPVPQGDGTGGLIPYKNGPALTAYYLSIFTLLCCITPVPLGFAATVLGVMGLQKRARQPEVKGSVHAWIGIVLGTISGLCSILMLVGLVISMLASGRR